jgi:hypothetical protein
MLKVEYFDYIASQAADAHTAVQSYTTLNRHILKDPAG